MNDLEKQYLYDSIKILEDLFNASIGVTNQLDSIYDKNNFTHFLLILLLKRANKFLRSYIMLLKNELVEPSMAIARSIFETNMWIRWIIIDEKNAVIYYKAGKTAFKKMMIKNRENKLFTDEQQKMLDVELKKFDQENTMYPKWSDIAKTTGMSTMFDLFYPVLSAMTHGSLMSMRGFVDKKEISENSDFVDISASIPLTNNFIRDCYIVCAEWIYNKKIRPLPNVKELLGL